MSAHQPCDDRYVVAHGHVGNHLELNEQSGRICLGFCRDQVPPENAVRPRGRGLVGVLARGEGPRLKRIGRTGVATSYAIATSFAATSCAVGASIDARYTRRRRACRVHAGKRQCSGIVAADK